MQPRFYPTPERVSQFLEMDHAQVHTQLKSVEGRKTLLEQLLEHEDDLKSTYPTFDASELQTHLDLVGSTLEEKERFLEEVQSGEKKGMIRRAFDRIKGFAVAHPFVTALGVAALAAAGAAAGFYLAGEWELLMTYTGLSRILGGAEAATELLPPTPMTPPLPGGGVFEIPVPAAPPDLGIPT